ncbi:hypothetical protein V1522DRAFT_89583 [Lipomyces starkeyi]
MYDYLRQRPILPSVYEVISTRESCKLYLDIEMTRVEGQTFTEDDCQHLTVALRAGIRQFVGLAFPTLTAEERAKDCVLQACDAGKYSIHYLHQQVLFDNAVCSGFAFVFELQVYLRTFLAQIIDATGEPHPIVRRAYEVGVVDLSVYKASQ